MARLNNGLDFELLTEKIFKEISSKHDDVSIRRNVSIKGIDGNRQIDLLISSKFAGCEFITIVECKDYNKKVDVKVIDGFHSVLQDISAHKGIIVSRKGFSSTAIVKAKRLGISLFSAHQANSDKWMIDLELPMLITEVNVKNLNINPVLQVKKGMIINPSAVNIINDIDIVASFIKNWNENTSFLDSHYIFQNDKINIKIGNLKPPFYMRDVYGKPVEITDYELIIEFDKKYYFSYINNIDNTLFLKSHSKDNSTLVIPMEVFSKYREYLTPIDKKSLKFESSTIVKMAMVRSKITKYSPT
ncbi:restriction endonuclease [Photobacterium damselae]